MTHILKMPRPEVIWKNVYNCTKELNLRETKILELRKTKNMISFFPKIQFNFRLLRQVRLGNHYQPWEFRWKALKIGWASRLKVFIRVDFLRKICMMDISPSIHPIQFPTLAAGTSWQSSSALGVSLKIAENWMSIVPKGI